MTNNDDLALELREAAESATKGSWRRTSTEFNGICVGPFSFTKEQVLARAVEKRDAIFISVANPENILSLLAERDADKKRIAELEQKADIYDMLRTDYELEGSLVDFVDWQAKRIEMLELYTTERDAQNQDLLLNIGSLQQRIAELETVCAESYQVVGALADAAGVFETSEAVSKALDNLSYAKLTHEDVMPFAVEARTVSVKLPKPHAHLIWIQAGRGPDDYWDDVAVSHSLKDRCCDGSERYPVYSIFEIQEACAAAGINLEVGE